MVPTQDLEISDSIVVLCPLQTATAQACKENTATGRFFRCMTQKILQRDLANLGILVPQERQELLAAISASRSYSIETTYLS